MKPSTRLSILSLFTLALVVDAHSAFADSKSECIATNETAQLERDSHRLIRARELYRQCASDQCPRVIRKDCAAAATDLDKRIPSVVARVKNPDGSDIVGVKGLLDGQVVAELADGQELLLDPGPHELRFEADGHLPKDVKLVVAEGEQRRAVDVVMDVDRPAPAKARVVAPVPAAPVAPASSSSGVPTGAYVVGGAGLVALGVGAGFYYVGLRQRSDDISNGCVTQSECDDRKSSIRTKLLVGDVLSGVGVVGLVSGVVWALSGPDEREVNESASPPVGSASVDVLPTPGGAMASGSRRSCHLSQSFRSGEGSLPATSHANAIAPNGETNPSGTFSAARSRSTDRPTTNTTRIVGRAEHADGRLVAVLGGIRTFRRVARVDAIHHVGGHSDGEKVDGPLHHCWARELSARPGTDGLAIRRWAAGAAAPKELEESEGRQANEPRRSWATRSGDRASAGIARGVSIGRRR